MPDLPPERRQAIADELRFHAQLEERAKLDKYVRASFAYDAGMTVRDLAAVFGISSAQAAQWKDWGEQERERRRREDPGRPGELPAVS
ncbi:MAG: helix-turn-helix domain-containing protein [Humibacter sp.]